MASKRIWFGVFLLIFGCVPACCIFFITPEDVQQGLVAIYGFAPRIYQGNDHRIGFGFRLGNHADFQVLYELGPQTVTKPLQSPQRIRSATSRVRVVRRRPLIEFLRKTGILQESSYGFDVVHNVDNEPR